MHLRAIVRFKIRYAPWLAILRPDVKPPSNSRTEEYKAQMLWRMPEKPGF
jgi:hypothetical protein